MTSISGRKVMRDGQQVTIYDGVVWTLSGKRGTLTIRDRNEGVAVESGEDAVGIGTWKVVRETGQYAGRLAADYRVPPALVGEARASWRAGEHSTQRVSPDSREISA